MPSHRTQNPTCSSTHTHIKSTIKSKTSRSCLHGCLRPRSCIAHLSAGDRQDIPRSWPSGWSHRKTCAPRGGGGTRLLCVGCLTAAWADSGQCNVKLGKAGYTMGSFAHFATFDSSTLASGSVLAHGVLGGAGLGIVSGACLHRVEALYNGIRGLLILLGSPQGFGPTVLSARPSQRLCLSSLTKNLAWSEAS